MSISIRAIMALLKDELPQFSNKQLLKKHQAATCLGKPEQNPRTQISLSPLEPTELLGQ